MLANEFDHHLLSKNLLPGHLHGHDTLGELLREVSCREACAGRWSESRHENAVLVQTRYDRRQGLATLSKARH